MQTNNDKLKQALPLKGLFTETTDLPSIVIKISIRVKQDLLIIPSNCLFVNECVCVFSGKESQSNGQVDVSQVNGLQTEELTQLREEVEELRKQHALFQTQLGDKDALISALVSRRLCTGFVCLCKLQAGRNGGVSCAGHATHRIGAATV